jgi:hypothetical protein
MLIKFDFYRYKEEGDPKLLVSLDWYTYEDRWTQRYMFDRPMWPDDMMEQTKKNNENRCAWFRISFNLFHLKMFLDIKTKHVGNVYHGRVMKDEPYVPSFVRKNREKKKQES